MPLNKLDNFLKNVEGRILYVSPSDLDASDAMSNQGNSQASPFKTIQRALIEAARFSYVPGNNNDITEKTTILLMPGEHIIDNRPGYKIERDGNDVKVRTARTNSIITNGKSELLLNLSSNFDLDQEDNILRKFNSVEGGVIVPRGTSIVGLDLRKTKVRPKYVPNPTTSYDKDPASAIFRITGACYFWQFSIFDGSLTDKVYVDSANFTDPELLVKPSFSHHKLTVFEYADGITLDKTTKLTDLNMYYHKLSIAYGSATEDRNISDKFPIKTEGFVSKRPEFEIVGAFASDPIKISKIFAGTEGGDADPVVTVQTATDHGLDKDTPIRIKGVGESAYNISTNVSSISVTNTREFTYTLSSFDGEIKNTNVNVTDAFVIVETDTVNGASPYIFNISLRSVFGMNGMHTDGAKATGFRSMVVAQFTGVSLQKDDRAFVKYNKESRTYDSITIPPEGTVGTALASQSSASSSSQVYHLDSDAIYRRGWETRHVKISNDSILQIVSVFAIGYGVHFEGRSGADASITNSNSNFGQLALVSDGFKRDAFAKDDRAFITHIIPPRAITSPVENIDWVSLDKQNASANKIYLFGFNSEDIKPPSLTQGFRIGAKTDDLLFVNIGTAERSAKIMMVDHGGGSTQSGVKKITGVTNDNGVFTSTNNHFLSTGEKVIIISDDGDLPENIEEKSVFFVIRDAVNPKKFKLSTSLTNAENGTSIPAIGGTNLTVLSRVTDKECGDVGHPVQFDSNLKQWYITVNSIDNTILSNLSGSGRTEPSFVKRISDTRSLDEKIYKLRLAIPKEIINSKNPENGFVIQESSNTGVRKVKDFTETPDLTTDDYLYDRNPRFISTCTFNSALKTVTIGLEKPHNLSVGDVITIKNIKDSTNTIGLGNSGYNRETSVSKIIDGLTIEVGTGETSPGAFATNDFNDKTSDSALQYPRYERTDLKSNIYIFRNNIISEFTNNTSDGVYQVFALNSSNNIAGEFQDLEYSQNVVDVYPQLDRDNVNENPSASKTFALRSPLGQVTTNDPLKSITRETTDKLLKKLGLGLKIESNVNSTNTLGIVTFTQDHNIGGIMTGTLTSGTQYTNGTYFNVKVYTDPSTQNDTTWNGTLAKVTVSSDVVSTFDITNPGSDMLGKIGYFDNAVLGGGSGAKITSTGLGLESDNVGVSTDLVLQITGVGVIPDSYFRIIGTNDKKSVSIAKTDGDVDPTSGQYGFIVGKSSKISTTTFSVGITTVTTSSPHGLVAGNKFQLNDSTNGNQGSFIVESKVGVSTFTFKTSSQIAEVNGHILKHGLSANDGLSGRGNENLAVRGVELFNKESAKLGVAADGSGVVMPTSTNLIKFDLSGDLNSTNLLKRFPYGSYILVDEEIMRISSTSTSGAGSDSLTVIRGVFGTTIAPHVDESLVKSIKAFPIQFNRPSILRASGHTFEYLGYGPGNYSTALPQVQIRTITEREEFLSQSQERSGGAVVYTGMNNKGDFYIGNQKKSALTGEETSFDTPIPSVAGEDPGRLSVVFDEVTVKDRIVVEGGKSKTVLSEFDGPVTFNNETQFKDSVKIKTTTDSTSPLTGALLISGGVGFAKTVHFADNARIKFGSEGAGDLQIYHTSDTESGRNSFVRDIGGGDLFLDTNGSKIGLIQDGFQTVQDSGVGGTLANFNKDGSVDLFYNAVKKFETLSVGATVHGTMFATTFSGSGSGLSDLNETTLKDSNKDVRAEATSNGVTITGVLNIVGGSTLTGNLGVTGQISATTTDSTKPAIIATNTGETNAIIQRWVGKKGSLEIQNSATGGGEGDYRIANTAGDNDQRITLYEDVDVNGGGIRFEVDDEFRMDIRKTSVRIGDPTLSDVDLLVTGDITAFHSSDIRLKDNISPITKALEKVKSISGNTYTKKSDGSAHTGVIAQEIEALGLPGITTTRSSGYMAVNYEKLVPLLIEAIKELSVEIDALKNK